MSGLVTSHQMALKLWRIKELVGIPLPLPYKLVYRIDITPK